jgi:hypothetical protein
MLHHKWKAEESRARNLRTFVDASRSFHNSVRYTALEAQQQFPRGKMQMSVKTAPEEVVNEGSKNDFLSLEEKVYRTIELLKNAREAKATAERDAARVREQLELREEELELAKAELITIKREREEVKGRVEKMLSQIDNIVAEQSAE